MSLIYYFSFYKTNAMLRYLLLFLLLFPFISPAFAQQPAKQEQVTGTWSGALSIGNTKLRLVFNISSKSDGTLTATMDSPDQGAKGIPVQSVRLAQDSIYLVIPAIGGSYAGKITSPIKMEGVLQQGVQAMPIAFTKGAIEALKRPQEPKKPYPYQEKDIIVENKEAGISLAGTITTPTGKGPYPAVILFTGSGPQDRDQNMMGHKPFLVLSDYLTRQGFAVLRLDDRGVGRSEGNFATATTRDFTADAAAAYNFLKSYAGVIPEKVGLIGHSEGALIAAKVAAQNPQVAFVVLMAGNGVPGTELLIAQNKALLQAAGVPDDLLQPYLALRDAQFKVAATEPDVLKAAEKIRKIEQEAKAKFTAQQQQQLGLTPQGEQAVVAQLSLPWFKYFLAYDPAPALQKLKMPVLALNGTKDLQVPYQQNLPAVEKALKAGGNKQFKIQELPNLNHLFQTAKTGTVTEYSQLEETVAPVALETIGNWLKLVVK